MPVGLILLVGPPAAGKTTFARAWVEGGSLDGAGVVSCDAIRADLFAGRVDVADDPVVFAEMDARVERRLAGGLAVVVDATNVLPHARARMIAWARRHARPVTALRFRVGRELLTRRNAARTGLARVPEAELLAYAAVRPSRAALRAEGVDIVVDVPGEEQGATPPAAASAVRLSLPPR